MLVDDSQIQVKVSLSKRLNTMLKSRSEDLGIPVTQFIKYLIIRELYPKNFPTFPVSSKTDIKAQEALRNIDKSFLIDNISEYFDTL